MYDVALDHRKNNFSLLKLAGTKHKEGRQAIIKLFQKLNKRKQRDHQSWAATYQKLQWKRRVETCIGMPQIKGLGQQSDWCSRGNAMKNRKQCVSESKQINGPAARPWHLADQARFVAGSILKKTHQVLSVATNREIRLQSTHHPSNLSSTSSGRPSTEPVQPGQQHQRPHPAQSGLLRHLQRVVASRQRRHRGWRGRHQTHIDRTCRVVAHRTWAEKCMRLIELTKWGKFHGVPYCHRASRLAWDSEPRFAMHQHRPCPCPSCT
jgi:hypothetical protein